MYSSKTCQWTPPRLMASLWSTWILVTRIVVLDKLPWIKIHHDLICFLCSFYNLLKLTLQIRMKNDMWPVSWTWWIWQVVKGWVRQEPQETDWKRLRKSTCHWAPWVMSSALWWIANLSTFHTETQNWPDCCKTPWVVIQRQSWSQTVLQRITIMMRP